MSDKIGAVDSGIITIDQPAALARENIMISGFSGSFLPSS
jgi:hypothetical protein